MNNTDRMRVCRKTYERTPAKLMLMSSLVGEVVLSPLLTAVAFKEVVVLSKRVMSSLS